MIRENRDDGLQSLRLVFAVLPFFLDVDLPSNFEDIKTVNVYAAHGDEGDDWKAHLDDQGQAWIITPLHYTIGGSNKIRSAAGGGRWLARDRQLKKHVDTFWYERKYKFNVENTNKRKATNEGMGLPKYTMIEHTPREDKPKYALCRITVDTKKSAHDRPPSSSQQPKRMPKRALCKITVDNENYANERPPSTSQQPKNMEIDHTYSNNGDKDNKNNAHDRPLSSSQQQEGKEFDHGNKGHKGGTYQNTTADYNQQNLERKLRELIKYHSFADIRKGLDQVESEILSAASLKEDSTEALVSNTTHGRCTYTNTMEAGTSTKWQEQAKVEMFESNSYLEKPTNLRCDSNRHCSDFGEQSSHHGNCNEKNAEQGTNTSNFATIHEPHTVEELLSLCNSDDMVEPNAAPQEPNQLSPNFNVSSTEPMDNQKRIAPNPSTSIFTTTEGRLDHQVQVQAPGPSASNHSTIVPENIDSNNIFDGLTNLNPEDLHANRSFTGRHENGTIWDNLPWDESKPDWLDWQLCTDGLLK